MATGVIQALHESGFPVIILESSKPSAIRRKVALSDAVYQKKQTVEGITACFAKNAEEAACMLQSDFEKIPLLVDENADFLKTAASLGIEVTCLIDAIIAKKNLGTSKKMAPLVIALGPGFTAGTSSDADCDAVIETMRGHNLGRIITEGSALPNTATPGVIGGAGKERVIHSPSAGIIELVHDIGDTVQKDEILAYVVTGLNKIPVAATIPGVLRGIIRNEFEVFKGMKIADIDPRSEEQKNCFTISDKSRALGNSTLHAVLFMARKKGITLW